jgi:serpin B
MQRRTGFVVWGWVVLLGVAGAASCSDDEASAGGGGYEASAGGGAYRKEPPGVLKATVQSRDLAPAVDGRDLTALVSGNTEFALSLFGQLREQSPEANIALGPYSISQAMAMLYAGARGDTAAEMQQVLRFTVAPATLPLHL